MLDKVQDVLQNASDEIKEMWLFWRIILFGNNETFESVDNMTLTDILQYNELIDIKEQVQKVLNSEIKP